VLEEDELEEAIERYGLKNVGYEIHRAFISDLKRKKNHEAVKRAQREARIKQHYPDNLRGGNNGL